MIRLSQIKCDVGLSKASVCKMLEKVIEKKLHIAKDTYRYQIHRKSLDCRPKHPLKEVYSVNVWCQDANQEASIVKKCKDKDVVLAKEVRYKTNIVDKREISKAPVVVGAGPAGLFSAYLLALNGYHPILLERGKSVDERAKDVDGFWDESRGLDPDSNVQFGEGGAGTFSDGKLNTSVKDKYGRQTFVLHTFVNCGAPEDIAYMAKPHVGTDYLKTVVKNLRQEIIALGGDVRFGAKVTSLQIDDGQVTGVKLQDGTVVETNDVILALGHSARDTFEMLYDKGLQMEQKPFAVGVRMEHPRELINALQYKEHKDHKGLPTADYKLTYQTINGRSVFTFCMCPGGYVVNAASEPESVVVNGMSNHDRMADNSNTAIVVSVTPDDFEGDHPLAGVAFQRQLEHAAFVAGNGKIPVQLFKDYQNGEKSTSFGEVMPCDKGAYQLANVRENLPEWVNSAIIEGVLFWDKKMPGYAKEDALILGVESRTSSPVKMLRDESMMSNIQGVYPCGEGAGYAGGIMSAAMDGLKVAECVMKK